MAYWLKLSELQKAREVAERGVRTIDARQEAERLDLWTAYFNLECVFGDKLDEVFVR